MDGLFVVTSELNDYESATLHYHQTLKNAHQLGFPTAIGVAHLNLANSYYKLNDKKKAFIHVDSSIYIFKLYDEKYFVSQTFLLKAKVFLDSNMLKESRTYIDSAMVYAIAIESLSDELEAIKVEASLLAKQGNYKKAYEKHILYHQMSDSLLTVNNKDKVAQLQVLFGKEQLESQLETEQMKVLISHEQLEKERNEKKYQEIRTYYILTILVIVFLVIAVLIYLRYVIITRKQQQSFSQNLIVNIDEERSRISKDLHDDVGQLLSSIKMKVNMYNTNQINSLKGLENEIGEVIEQTRSLSHTLHPSYIEKIGLKRSLASLIERTQQNTGKVCSFEWEVDIEDFSIDKRTQIFRIIQECINNTIKHSQASALKVVAQSQGQNVLITYRDNGIGFGNLTSLNSGIGLKTIEERSKKIDAKIHIESTKGKGFKLTLKI